MRLFNQPASVFLLSFVQLWSRFSHFGMRALLLLYMVKMLKFDDPRALGIFAVYCALVERGLASSVAGALLPTEQPFLYTVSATATDGTKLATLEAALLEVPDRGALMARGRNYSAVRAAERFLEIAAELHPQPARSNGPFAVAGRQMAL